MKEKRARKLVNNETSGLEKSRWILGHLNLPGTGQNHIFHIAFHLLWEPFLLHQDSAWHNHTLRCVSFLSPEHDGVWPVPFSWIIPNINQTFLTPVTDIHELEFKQSSYLGLTGRNTQNLWKTSEVNDESLFKNLNKYLTGKTKRPCCFHRANINLLISWLKQKWKNDSQRVPLLLLSK